jgi:hypothetical protein
MDTKKGNNTKKTEKKTNFFLNNYLTTNLFHLFIILVLLSFKL